MEKQLNKLYKKPEDLNRINIKKDYIINIGSKLICVYKKEFEVIKQLIKNYDLTDIKSKIVTFGSLQTMIFVVFDISLDESVS